MYYLTSSRISCYLASLGAYQEVGVPLLALYDGVISALQCCDDLGFYLYASTIGVMTGCDPITAVRLLFAGLMGVFFLLTTLALVALVKNRWGYGVVIVGMSYFAYTMWEVSYVYLPTMLPFLGIPLVMLAQKRRSARLYWVTFFLLGFFGAIADLMRIYSLLPVALFFVSFLMFDRTFSVRKKLIAIAIFLVGYAIPYAHFSYAIYQRDQYLMEHNLEPGRVDQHVLWHNIYIGFGFLQNSYGIAWDDECGEKHARLLVPGIKEHEKVYGTPQYEGLVRKLVINLVKKDFRFVIKTLFAKAGVIVFFFLLYLGLLGLLAAFFVPKPWYVEVGFLSAAGVSALPGILTLPEKVYITGFIACTFIYSIYTIILFLNNDGFNHVVTWIKARKKQG